MLRLINTYTLGFGIFLFFSGLTPVWADHSAPAPQLGGVEFCLTLSSVQLETEAVSLSPAAGRRVREGVLKAFQTQLETHGIPHASNCSASRSFTLLSLYVRFLDPETYIGFPENSYTYVTSAQVGRFVSDVTTETSLPESLYTASVSDIFQAATPEQLEQRLVALGEAEAGALTRTWLETNTVALSRYLLFAALGLSFVALRVMNTLLR